MIFDNALHRRATAVFFVRQRCISDLVSLQATSVLKRLEQVGLWGDFTGDCVNYLAALKGGEECGEIAAFGFKW